MLQVKDVNVSQPEFLHNFHLCIKKSLQTLAEVALLRMNTTKHDGEKTKPYLVLESYVSHGPKMENLFGMKRDNDTLFPCHRSLMYKDDFANCCSGTPKHLKQTRQLMETMDLSGDSTNVSNLNGTINPFLFWFCLTLQSRGYISALMCVLHDVTNKSRVAELECHRSWENIWPTC